MTMMIRGRPVPDGARFFTTFRVHTLGRQTDCLFLLCLLVVAASLFLGGGTRGGFLSDVILQLLAIPLLLLALWRMIDVELTAGMRMAAWFCLAIAALPLIQLIPLPPPVWTALPGRETLVETFELLGRSLPWMPVSVSPYETWLSALSLLPPLGIFLGTMLLGYRQRRLLIVATLVIGLLGVFIGLLQVAQGPESALRFFEFTNESEAVGFFANRNHFAALLYALLLFAAAWTVSTTTAGTTGRRLKDYDIRSIIMIVGVFTVLVILLAGQAMARSRAGLGFTIVALLGGFALGVSNRRIGSSLTSARVFLFASVLALIFTVQFALYRIMDRFVFDPLQDARIPFASNTIDAAIAFMPFGSGLGTFVPVYAMFEKPADVIANTFANRAHNDVLELWLNTGVLGLVLLIMFIVWLALRSVDVWRRVPTGATELDWLLARAATMTIVLLLAHSFVDYPLRTGAVMAVMALACALLIEPPTSIRDIKATNSPGRRKLRHTRRPRPTTAPSPETSPGMGLSSDRRWGADEVWPEKWSKNSERDPTTGAGPASAETGDESNGGLKNND